MRPRFRVGTHRPTNIYVQVGPMPDERDPQIGYIQEGWSDVLVDQANESDVVVLDGNTTSFTVLPSPADSPTDRFAALLGAARAVTRQWPVDETIQSTKMNEALDGLYGAVAAWGPYDQDAAR